MLKKCEIVHIHQKPWLRPKPGQAKPDFWLWAQLMISSSPGCLKPGQSQGFQAKLEPAHHYTEPSSNEMSIIQITTLSPSNDSSVDGKCSKTASILWNSSGILSVDLRSTGSQYYFWTANAVKKSIVD